MTDLIPDPPTNIKPEENIVKKIVEPNSSNVLPEINSEPKIIPESEIKEKRKYNKDPNKKHGNPNWKKGGISGRYLTKSEKSTKSIEKKIDKSENKTEVKKDKVPSKSMLYVGIGIGIFITGIGIYALYRKIKEKVKSNSEIKALKEILDENEKQVNERNDKELGVM